MTPDARARVPSQDPAFAVVAGARAGLPQAIAAEWIRLRSVRATWALLGIIALALPGLAAVVALTGSVVPDDTVLGASLVGGGALALLAAGGLGATTVTTEARSGGLATSCAATPRRGTLLTAQAMLLFAVTAAIALPCAWAALLVGSALLDHQQLDLAPGDPMPALLGVALLVGCSGALGIALGTILRHPGAALAAVGAIVLLPAMLGPLLGGPGEWLRGLSFTGVLASIAQSSDAVGGSVGSWGAWPTLLLLLVGTLGMLALAAWAARRDL